MNDARPTEFDGRIKEGKDWREIVAFVSDLPPMPQVASRAITMVEDPNTTAEDLNDLLSSDTALAARVLKIANSAMFSRQREIKTLTQAIMVIGFKALKGIIVAATLRQLNKRFGNTERMIWENAMSTAMCATTITRKLGKKYVEEIFLLGLLHNLGQVVLLAQDETSNSYKDILAMIKDQQFFYHEAEHEVLGFSHPLIGALVAKKWNFSPESCQVILHYCDPLSAGDSPADEQAEKIAIVRLADLITHHAQIGTPEGYPEVFELAVEAAQYLGFKDANINEAIEKLSEETKERFEAEGSIYS